GRVVDDLLGSRLVARETVGLGGGHLAHDELDDRALDLAAEDDDLFVRADVLGGDARRLGAVDEDPGAGLEVADLLDPDEVGRLGEDDRVEDVVVRGRLAEPLEEALLRVAEQARVEEVDLDASLVEDRERIEVGEVREVIELERAASETL